jgi:hypothetical protein
MRTFFVLAGALFAALAATAQAAEPGTWTDVTPAGLTLTGNDNYGVQDVLADPAHPGDFYAFTCRSGVWKSKDYGQTWKKVSLDGGPMDQGKNWGSAIAPDGSYMLATTSSSRSLYKSTDGGIHWEASPETTLWPYNVEIDPADKKHVIATGHGENHLIESSDAGATWTDQGAMGQATASSYVHFLLDGNTVLAVSGDKPEAGSWRGVKADSKWTWTKVSNQEHDHGSHQLFVDAKHKVIYNPGAAPGLGIQKSDDNGLTWTTISKEAADALIASPTMLYACRSFPVQNRFAPHFQQASAAAPARWTALPTPKDMSNGAKRFAVTFDGKNYILISGHWCGGIWRYVEPAQDQRPAASQPAP